MLDTSDLDTVVETIRDGATAIRSVDLDPARLTTLPAVWVRLDGFDELTLDRGLEVRLQLIAVAAGRDYRRALDDLADVLDELVPLVRGYGPLGSVDPVTVALPGQGALPGLRVPLTIHTTP